MTDLQVLEEIKATQKALSNTWDAIEVEKQKPFWRRRRKLIKALKIEEHLLKQQHANLWEFLSYQSQDPDIQQAARNASMALGTTGD